MNPQHLSPKEILLNRGILEQALLAGWIEESNYWAYTVRNRANQQIATRYKKYPFTDSNGLKYHWGKEGKPQDRDSDWYILEQSYKAIAETGVMWLVNGEPAYLSMLAAGIDNAGSTTLSEVSYPKEGNRQLREFGVNRICYVVDNDMAGYNSAIVWRDAVIGTGIDFEAFTWGNKQETRIEVDKQGKAHEFIACSDIPDKADANDIWIALNFDKQAFQEKLKSLKPLSLPLPKEKRQKAPIQVDFTEAHSKLARDVFEALSARGLLTGKKFPSGFHQLLCPYHEDRQPSAGIDPNTGVINCFRCKEPHGLIDNAKLLGINHKSYYPKQEGKKKPLKAEIRAFEQSLDTIPDSRTYEDILRDEISARMQAYDAGQFIGFGRWQKLPLSILTAVLTLCNGRSNTALFLGRLHEALVTGKLPSICNYEMIMKALNLPYKTVFKAMFELSALSFFPKLSGINNIDSMLSIETGKNLEGRPCDWFMVEFEADEIRSLLTKQLEIHFLEKTSKKALAMPDQAMLSAYGISELDGIDYRNRIKEALSEKANKQAKQAYDAEMFGDGKWQGWYKAIESEAVAPLNYGQYKDVMDLRAAILKWWIEKKRAVNSREELCRLLGCSDATIDKVMERANITSERQQTKVEFQAPETVRQMAYLWGKEQRNLQGKAWKGGFRLKGEKEWLPIDEKDYLKTFASFAGRIEKGYMLIITPSKQRPMTEKEIADRDAKLALEAQEKAQDRPKEGKIEGDRVESQKTMKMPYFGKHSYTFLYRQLQLLFHVYTDYSLGTKQAIVFDKNEKPVTSGQLPALKAFFLSVASDKPKRTVKSFYGKNYDEGIDFAELQALADSQREKFGLIEVDLEETESLPVQKVMEELTNQVPESAAKTAPIPPLPKLPELPKLPLKEKEGFTPIDWTKNQTLFDERMKAIGAI